MNKPTDEELGQMAFAAFRSDGNFVWKYLGDKDRWIKVGKTLYEFGFFLGAEYKEKK